MDWITVCHPLTNYDKVPPAGKLVLVWIKDHDLPCCGFTYSGRWAISGKPLLDPIVVSWNDCLPERGPNMPEAAQYSQDQPEFKPLLSLLTRAMDIPAVKDWPFTAGQCDDCGGHGCDSCGNKGWHADPNDPGVRRCDRMKCGKVLKPNHIAVYCSDECAIEDA